MATVTPNATPKGGFPLVLTTQKEDGDVVQVTFPTSSAVEVNRTNLFPIPRPRAGSAWTTTGLTTTLGQSDAVGVPHPAFALTDLGKGVATGAASVIDYAAATALAASATTSYAVSAFVYLKSDAVSQSVRLDLLSIDGSNVITPVVGSSVTLPKAGWWRIVQTGTTGGTAAKAAVRINHLTTTVGDTIYWGGGMVELAANAGAYHDGASDVESAWTGTAFASSSLQTVDPNLYKSMRVTNAADALAAAAT